MPTTIIAEDDDGIRLDRWFQRHATGTSFNIVSRWARTGAIRLDGAKASPGDRIAAGQTLLYPDSLPEPSPTTRERRTIEVRDPLSQAQIDYIRGLVIYEDRHAIVINKPPGLATQGGIGITTHVDGLLDALTGEMTTRPKLVHRLDKDTSGVLLLARTARAAAFFAKAFAGREARKTYWALTIGVPKVEAGEIDAPLSKQPGSGGEKMHVDTETGLKSKTRYRVIERAAGRAAWVEFSPLTGRTHQIRVHAAAIGHAIVGDAKYGGKEAFLTGGISRKLHLHARRLVIDAPDGGHIDISADLPGHIAESFAMLGFDMALGAPLVITALSATPKPKSRRLSSATSGNRRGERRSRGS
ncbi:RluA family pseudouridine synthase [Polymorphobacter fuscus]|uniref:RNA pseudouridine synthase n=1 Tax=Sandarakinorhabdus fusca TaxID=1439888 RepID=A0A7C9KJ47_9SPHN|nr:RluA family pseudouridine synthase [Polymorphobacter fuscus]KAB7646534.1 RluA family pseudouridine synthase [Polymorphobacter fuscus]MQT17781.1 RNA pseudouridine synthase [Polymorphobacter fuscus]NJC09671.1 23S rRNA pseudouridine955/2504/2580 synthase [Polymorphobacter fuscus]